VDKAHNILLTHKSYLHPANMTAHSGLPTPVVGDGDMAGDKGSCFRRTTGVDDRLSVPLPVSDMIGFAGDIERAGFATAMMLPPLDAITCTKTIL
jgi:hypothetical protein